MNSEISLSEWKVETLKIRVSFNKCHHREELKRKKVSGEGNREEQLRK